MGRYITTKADFTLRRKHKKYSGATIYENDYTTINPMPNAFSNEYVIGDSNFIFTTRPGVNGQKKHVRGKFVKNPSGITDEYGSYAWTSENIIDSGISEESRIRLKPNYTSIADFACYGSATKLVQGTLNGVITDFPAEIYFSNESLGIKQVQGSNYTYGEGPEKTAFNEFNIDLITKNIQPENVYNPLRYFALCGSSYTYIDSSGTEYEFKGFTVTLTSVGTCYNQKKVDVDKIATTVLSFDGKSVTINTFRDNNDGNFYYSWTGAAAGDRIRPKREIIEEYFRTCDDFTAVLLDRESNPIYKATFETPKESETGFSYTMVDYIWPTFNGGFNPDLSGPYFSYLRNLMALAEVYDEYFTDNVWRSLTHEAIKTLDWTYVSNTDGEISEMASIDTSRIEPIARIYGRQFDDLKRYTEGIKSINTITYNQKGNTPDYTLTDVVENSGWEAKTLDITTDKSIRTDALYSGLTTGFTSSEANSEFFRRLKLNSSYLQSVKGTRKGLDAMLAMLGFEPDEYEVHEYVEIAKGTGNYTSFCSETEDLPKLGYPFAKDVATINKYKINFDANDPYGDYCGIPVAEVGYFEGEGDDEKDLSYVVPWYSQGKKYDDGLYFQMSGGWGKREKKKIELEIAPDITEIEGDFIYDETQTRLKFAEDFDELLQGAFVSSKQNDVFYVTDITLMSEQYTSGDSEDMTNVSHYFILENEDLNQFLGYSVSGITGYGWRNIKEDEITANTTSAGTLVLYLESIQDNTVGNNPHIGDGTYDEGQSYIDSMGDIFGYSLVNKNFIGIDDSACTKIQDYVFDMEQKEDNRKCWFFSDNYNSGETRSGSSYATLSFVEATITSQKCSDKTYTDVVAALEGGSENSIPVAGSGDYFSGAAKYWRTTEIEPYNPINTASTSGEASADSVVNVKNLDIVFNLKNNPFPEETEEYINRCVIPYITQMIPSTSILKWDFSE